MTKRRLKKNKNYSINKNENDQNPISYFYGKIFLIVGICWIALTFILSVIPTNLDGQTLETVLLVIFYGIGILEIGYGLYLIIKKPKWKAGKFLAKRMVKEMKKSGIKMTKEEEKKWIEQHQNDIF